MLCHLDPVPTLLLKGYVLTFPPIISQIVNLSIDQASAPSLYPDSPQNYRPVSNLQFLFKFLKVFFLLDSLINLLANDLFASFQSAYRPHHNVEILLVNVSNFVLLEMDRGNITAMLLLDLSSAFDTANHTILLNTLRSHGVKGQAY